jgi:hypothetical protein
VDTTGESAASITAHLVLYATFAIVAVNLLRGRPKPFPALAVAVVLVVGIPSLLQFALPSLGAALERDPAATLRHGEWWRPATALLAQDGGLVAAVFTLVVVGYLALIGEWAWGRWRTVLAFLGTSIVVNLIALAWGTRGGGSSFASDGLVLALTVWAVLRRTTTPPVALPLPLRIVAVLQLALGVVLVVLNDAHGLAMLVGAAVGVVVAIADRAPERRPSAADGTPASGG